MSREHGAGLDAAVVALVALAVHGRSIGFGYTDLDDRDLLVDDQAFLAQPSSLWRVFGRAYMHVVDAAHAYYRPLVTWTFALDARWSGARPLGYHLTNVVLYAVAAVLLWKLLELARVGRSAALLGALVFAVHPTLVPAVAWIPGRNDSLLCVLALGAWIAMLRRRPVVHGVLFGLALLTKETAAALAFVFAAHAILLEPELRSRRVLAGYAATWSALVAARALVHPVGITPTIANLSLVAGGLGALVLPVHLSPVSSALDVPLWPGVLAIAALAGTGFIPGARRRVVALGLVAFAAPLLPSVMLPGSLVLDSRLTLPSVGVVLVLAEVLRALAPEARSLAAFGGVAVAALAAVTVGYQSSFRDARAFALAAVAGSPHCAMAHFCLGQSYQRQGDDDRALSEYRDALDLGPGEVVHNDIAVIYMHRSQWSEAEAELREELSLQPRYAKAYYNLGIVLRREDRMRDACDAEGTAVDLAPDDAAARVERDRDCDGR